MAETALPSAESREHPHGVIPELVRLSGSFGDHLQGLLQLAGIETKEAAWIGVRLLIFSVAAIVLSIFGYVLLLLFLAFLLALVFHISWIWISLGLAVLHLVAVALCAIFAKNCLRKPVFKATMAELRRDFEAMKEFKS
jgi:uncharacterized membrane protein YqjE